MSPPTRVLVQPRTHATHSTTSPSDPIYNTHSGPSHCGLGGGPYIDTPQLTLLFIFECSERIQM